MAYKDLSKFKYIISKSDEAEFNMVNTPLFWFNWGFSLSEPYVDKMVLVSEDLIERSIVKLFEVDKSVIEGAGAVGLAAVMSGKLPELLGKK